MFDHVAVPESLMMMVVALFTAGTTVASLEGYTIIKIVCYLCYYIVYTIAIYLYTYSHE